MTASEAEHSSVGAEYPSAVQMKKKEKPRKSKKSQPLQLEEDVDRRASPGRAPILEGSNDVLEKEKEKKQQEKKSKKSKKPKSKDGKPNKSSKSSTSSKKSEKEKTAGEYSSHKSAPEPRAKSKIRPGSDLRSLPEGLLMIRTEDGLPKLGATKRDKLERGLGSIYSSHSTFTTVATESSEGTFVDERPVRYDSLIFTAIYVSFILYILIKTWIVAAILRSLEDGYWLRLVYFIFMPFVFGMMLFPAKVVVFSCLCLLGSWRNIDENSTTHSAIKPPVPSVLPKILIQMPVYKENFEETIKPSLDNIHECILYYRARGGEVDMFINDDGLQLISEEERQERIAFYNEYNIAYAARPSPKLLERRGLFKKASNMNFCLNFAREVDKVEEDFPELDKKAAIEHAMSSRPYPILAGGPVGMDGVKNILLVDSDTRVPVACLYDTVGEFVICPNLGFCQHNIGVLRVQDNYWEDFLANFTDLLYSVYIALGTSCGEPPPLVGHNATLNWVAMKEASWFDEDVKYRCFWSEKHVSEDFDMSLRLQSAGYVGRYITYTGNEFKEGVSISVFDEMIKLKKYAYGTSEMLFNKVKDWPRRGVISPLMWAYLRSNVRLDGKINMIAYLFTYVGK
jgi:hypothetical protein